MQGNATTAYTFVNTATHLEEVCQQLNEQEWVGFDTEFIGEKRYYTLLCLIQIDCPIGSFLIDPITCLLYTSDAADE